MTGNDAIVNTELSSAENLNDAFRQAMRQLVATITIITAGGEASRAGMVATAVMSVSARPPSLAIGVNRDTSVWAAITQTGRFAVNLLSTAHTDLVHPFSGQLQGEDRFRVGSWKHHALDVPYLQDAVVTLFCTVAEAVAYGTHTVFIGAVKDIQFAKGTNAPLLWKDGGFANAVPLETLLD